MSKESDATTTTVDSYSLDELAKKVLKELLTMGVDPEVASAFICFRFHPQCPWGLGRIKLNDMMTYAIVRPTDDSMEKVECVFVATNEKMTCLSELQGIEKIPEKSKLN